MSKKSLAASSPLKRAFIMPQSLHLLTRAFKSQPITQRERKQESSGNPHPKIKSMDRRAQKQHINHRLRENPFTTMSIAELWFGGSTHDRGIKSRNHNFVLQELVFSSPSFLQ